MMLPTSEREEIEKELIRGLEDFKKWAFTYPPDFLEIDIGMSEKKVFLRNATNRNDFLSSFPEVIVLCPDSQNKIYVKSEYEKHKLELLKSETYKDYKIPKSSLCSLCQTEQKRTLLCLRKEEWVCPNCCSLCNKCFRSARKWICEGCGIKNECGTKEKIMVNYGGCEKYEPKDFYEVIR